METTAAADPGLRASFIEVSGVVSDWMIPVLFIVMVLMGMVKKKSVYESFIEGGKEGFNIFLRILPFLVAIIVAIGLFRECGVLDVISQFAAPYLRGIRMPTEVLPIALMRPLSGSGSMGIASEVIKNDPNGYTSMVAATVFGATDTTFYVIALYFGSVGVKKIRQALIAGLIADVVGILVACQVCYYLFDGAKYFANH